MYSTNRKTKKTNIAWFLTLYPFLRAVWHTCDPTTPDAPMTQIRFVIAILFLFLFLSLVLVFKIILVFKVFFMQKYCFTLYSLLFCLASTTSLLKTIYPQPLWASFGWRRRVASVGGAMLTLHTGWKDMELVWYFNWHLCNGTTDWRKDRGTDLLQLFQPGRGVSEKVSAVGFCLGSGLFGSCNSN